MDPGAFSWLQAGFACRRSRRIRVDGSALGGATCKSQDYDGGTLACDDSCLFDEDNCFFSE